MGNRENFTQPRCGEVMPKGTLVRDVNKARAALRSEEFLCVAGNSREVSFAGGRFPFFWGENGKNCVVLFFLRKKQGGFCCLVGKARFFFE